ncbi:MAG: hypothetical protein OSJ27_01570 [Candidatus Gastranaerophilales bacterium]|nr:hypothetical protein [Candidatus Gastranaerophilales bacterium]
MENLLIFLIIINVLLIVSLFFGMQNIFKEETNPKLRAYYSIYLSVLLFLYLAMIIVVALHYFILAHYGTSPFLFMFFIFPFAIGNFASYKRLRFFTFLQIIVFILSLIYIVYLYANFKYI